MQPIRRQTPIRVSTPRADYTMTPGSSVVTILPMADAQEERDWDALMEAQARAKAKAA